MFQKKFTWNWNWNSQKWNLNSFRQVISTTPPSTWTALWSRRSTKPFSRKCWPNPPLKSTSTTVRRATKSQKNFKKNSTIISKISTNSKKKKLAKIQKNIPKFFAVFFSFLSFPKHFKIFQKNSKNKFLRNSTKSPKNIPNLFAIFCHFLSFSFPLWTDPIPCDCDLAWIVRDNRQFFPRVFGNCLSVDGNKTWFNNDAQVQLLTDDLESCWLSLHFVPFFVPFRTFSYPNFCKCKCWLCNSKWSKHFTARLTNITAIKLNWIESCPSFSTFSADEWHFQVIVPTVVAAACQL